MTQLFAGVNVCSFIQQIANYLYVTLSCCQKERHAAITTRVDSCTGEMKPPHSTQVSVHRRLGESSLSLLPDKRQAIHDRQRKNGCAAKGDRSHKHACWDIANHPLLDLVSLGSGYCPSKRAVARFET